MIILTSCTISLLIVFGFLYWYHCSLTEQLMAMAKHIDGLTAEVDKLKKRLKEG